jgi:hypothetical protein
MSRKFHYGARFEEAHQDFTRKPASTSWSLGTALSAIRDALGEGLAAHRQYGHLKSRGMSQDTASKWRSAFAIRQVKYPPHHRTGLQNGCAGVSSAQTGHRGFSAAVNAGRLQSLMIGCCAILVSPAHRHCRNQGSPYSLQAGHSAQGKAALMSNPTTAERQLFSWKRVRHVSASISICLVVGHLRLLQQVTNH